MLFVVKHICKFSLKAAGHFFEEWVVRLHNHGGQMTL